MKIIKPRLLKSKSRQDFELCGMKSLISVEDTLFALHFVFLFTQVRVYSKS